MSEDDPTSHDSPAASPDSGRPSADPTRIVADADVLAADLLVGGDARAALDHVRAHSWIALVASDALLDDAEGAVTDLTADAALAGDWRERLEAETVLVAHAPGDHPALAAAHEGNAAHVLTLDESLASAATNRGLQSRVAVSVRTPDAFARLFDARSLYEATHDGDYPGPDRDPRA